MNDHLYFIDIDKLKITTSIVSGLYPTSRPFSIHCNFTFDQTARDTIYSKWKVKGKYYVDGSHISTSLQLFDHAGQHTLVYRNPSILDSGRIECEVGYIAGTSMKRFSAISSGFITIAGSHNISYF